ncbi:MAG: metal-sulfur cluster assembly factor [Solirubrobacterales bacterium]
MLTQPDVLDALRQVLDPDVGINIVDLGLVESVEVAEGAVRVGMIMTTPACPQSSYLQDEAMRAVAGMAPGLAVTVEVLPEPFWSPDRLSSMAREILGW